MRRQRDDRATELLVSYLRHVEEAMASNRPSDEVVIVLPERAEVVERLNEGRAAQIKLRIEQAT